MPFSVKPVQRNPLANVEHLTLIAFPTLGNLTTSLGPWGRDIFFAGEMEPNHIITCSSVCLVVTMEKNVGVLEVSTCFQGINQLLRTHFQYILIEFLTCGD